MCTATKTRIHCLVVKPPQPPDGMADWRRKWMVHSFFRHRLPVAASSFFFPSLFPSRVEIGRQGKDLNKKKSLLYWIRGMKIQPVLDRDSDSMKARTIACSTVSRVGNCHSILYLGLEGAYRARKGNSCLSSDAHPYNVVLTQRERESVLMTGSCSSSAMAGRCSHLPVSLQHNNAGNQEMFYLNLVARINPPERAPSSL